MVTHQEEKYPHRRDWDAVICQGDPGPVVLI